MRGCEIFLQGLYCATSKHSCGRDPAFSITVRMDRQPDPFLEAAGQWRLAPRVQLHSSQPP